MRTAGENRYDVIVVGAGPGGSLTAMMLASRGRRVALLDRDVFPRFAIGESSTPIADRTLEQIAADYDLPQLRPLARWGRWRRSIPGLTGGLKRGFTYFDHRGWSSTSFASLMAEPTKRLLVAASPSDDQGDTHWLRADVDQYLIALCRDLGADVRLGCALETVQAASPWRILVRNHDSDGQRETLLCDRIVDASGRAAVALRTQGWRDAVTSLRTNTQAKFTHLIDAGSAAPVSSPDLPYPPLAAAVHHLLRDGWVWQLPFADGRVSVGRVWNRCLPSLASGHPTTSLGSPSDLARNFDAVGYPLVENWLGDCSLARTPGRWIESARVQHRLDNDAPMSIDLLPLPTTLATIDPLHSTGLAQAITGAQRVSDLILRDAAGEVARYAENVRAEMELLDRVIFLAYRVWQRTDLIFAAGMLYFALAIADEEQRVGAGFRPWAATWGAGQESTQRVMEDAEAMILAALGSGQRVCRASFSRTLRGICDVPLADREDNLYGYTFANP